jgi:Tol biopolymer transport system component
MKSKQLLLCLTFIVSLASSCKKDQNPPKTTNPTTPSAGTYLLFDADPDNNSGASQSAAHTELFYSKLDGTGITQITNIPSGYFDYRASFSPDGKQVVFVRDDYADNPDTARSVRTVSINGGTPKTIAKGNNIDYPAFSPDGTQIAYAIGINNSSPYNYEIYISNADGSNQKKITTFSSTGDISSIHWAGDGKIYFNAQGNGNAKTGIYSMNADGTSMSFISQAALMSISPDNKYLLYTTAQGLYYSNSDGTNTHLILSDDQGNLGSPAGASFTKDQKQVYF